MSREDSGYRQDYEGGVTRRTVAILISTILVLGVFFGVTFSTVVAVDTGYTAVLVDPISGSITQGPTGPYWGMFIKAPWVSVVGIRVAVDSIYMWSDRDPDTGSITKTGAEEDDWEAPTALSNDGLPIMVDLNVFWTLDPSKIINLYRNFPALDYKDRVIAQILRESVRDVVVRFTAIETFERRAELPDLLKIEVVKKIGETPSLAGSFQIEQVQVLDIKLPINVVKSIEEKKAAEQQVLTASFKRQQAIIEADAERQQVIIRVNGTATAKIVESQGIRDAIMTVVSQFGGNQTEANRLYENYLTLLMLREIASTGSNVVLLIGRSGDGTFFMLPLEP